MAVNRVLPTISSNPGGLGGTAWTNAASDSLAALWGLNGGRLQSVVGTNTITASLSQATGFTSYTDGLRVTLTPAGSNTGATTLNIEGIGAKSIVTAAGSATTLGDLVTDNDVDLVFDASIDSWRILGGGGTVINNISGGVQLKRSAPARAPSETSSSTAIETLVTLAFQATDADSRVVIEGSVQILTGSGSSSATGILVGLYNDGVLDSTFTARVEPNMLFSIPVYFEILPADIVSHSYSLRVSSTIPAVYAGSATYIVASEVTPN